MSQQYRWRRLVGAGLATALTVTGVAVVGVVVVATPAYAGFDSYGFHPTRFEESSLSNTIQTKSITAECPDGWVLYAAGGRTDGANTGVSLTGIVPNADLTSVTVTGKARTGQSGRWSVTAVATCAEPAAAPELFTGESVGTAEAYCDPGLVVFGTGFELVGDVNTYFIDEVIPAEDLSMVSVHARGNGPWGAQGAVRSYAICAAHADPSNPLGVRVEASTGFSSASPKTANSPECRSTGETAGWTHCWALGVGGEINGQGTNYLDALMPRDGQESVRARGVHIAGSTPPLPPPGPRFRSKMVGPDDTETTVYGVLIGSWY